MQPTTPRFANRSLGEWLSSLPTLVILLITIFLSSGEILHSQLLKIGENNWDDYFLLRGAGVVQEPTCDPNPNIDVELARVVAEKKAAMADDPLASIFGTDVDEGALRQSLVSAARICQEKWDRYTIIQERVTPGVKAFRTLEVGVQKMVSTINEYKRLLLALLVLICAATATLSLHHISLRPITTRKDYYVGTAAQLAANCMLLMSATVYRVQEAASMAQGVQVQDFYLHAFWIAGFAGLVLINLWQLARPPRTLEPGGGFGKALLTIPLYSFMSLTAGAQFVSQGYYQGISVYLGMMMELSTMFLNLALYIWIGMMLKQTRMAHLVFDIFRPWKMSPELLCFVVLFVTAFPTAYTGASGIFVIAAGAVIYNELMRAGARPQLALAATAMSGSMGVVLRPCLLVVIIAALNKDVTTAELFGSGWKIFMMSIIMFFVVSQFFRQEPARVAPFGEALPQSVRRLAPLLPYVVVMATVVVFFRDALDRRLDEFSAPIILPVMLLGVLLYEKWSHRILLLAEAVLWLMVATSLYRCAITWGAPEMFGLAAYGDKVAGEILFRDILLIGVLIANHLVGKEPPADTGEHTHVGEVSSKFEGAIRFATNETTGHIGALLMLMALSVSTGGIIERSGIMEALPETFASVWIAAALLVVVMVIIGMFMDPYGAVILVNATIAQVAFKNGIDPLHFWMICLVAFELGYLTPPVALNHLLTRQVVGDREVESARLGRDVPFMRRYEKFILPIIVMGTMLLSVAFLPLAFEGIHEWLFHKIVR